jgi:hypothetical protein
LEPLFKPIYGVYTTAFATLIVDQHFLAAQVFHHDAILYPKFAQTGIDCKLLVAQPLLRRKHPLVISTGLLYALNQHF